MIDVINNTSSNKHVYVVFILITALAIGTRFYKISEWPFAYDETATIKEVDSFANPTKYPATSQTYRLPRIIPLAYSVHYVGYKLFGENELGTRMAPAIASVCNIIIIFIIVQSLYGITASTMASLLVIFFPDYLYYAQQNRHYSIMVLFTTITFLAGLYMVVKNSINACVVACTSIVLGYFCHTISIVFLGILFLAIIVESIFEKKKPSVYMLSIIAITAFILIAIYILYTRRYILNWNTGATWGYSVYHAIISSMNQIGWPYFILIAVVSMYFIKYQSAENWYFLLHIIFFSTFVILLPKVMPFAPAYILPFSICIFIIMGVFLGQLIDKTVSRCNVFYYIIIASVCLLSMPSFISYYKDGSRYDYRKAAKYVIKNWQSGDKVTAFAIGQFGYYAPDLKPAYRLDLETKTAIQQLSVYNSNPGRLWVVAQSHRGGLNIELKNWIWNNCSLQFVSQQRRYDYHEYTTEVYVCKNK